jgi:serine protease Do
MMMLWNRAVLKIGFLAGLAVMPSWAQARPVNNVTAAPGSYLGIWMWEVDAARARELRLPEPGGIEVTLVSPGSPADLAGVRAGDVVEEYNGQKTGNIEQFSRMVRDTPPGRQVKLRVFRNGTSQVLTAKIEAISAADRPPAIQGARPGPPPERQDVPRSLMTWRSPVLGIDAEPLFAQLAAFFGVAEGVLVRSVASGSPAEKAGLRAGDVITRVGKAPVAAPAEITARLRVLTTPTAQLTIVRDRKETVVTVTLE